ncbi:cytochrome c [Ostreiculturibacter nitratireducens]|uniref:c-type cytochrome n=1 Tax=Ostreiculturibacter nitratireducens TaxID=3075226 RepID=UPI0031B5ED0D
MRNGSLLAALTVTSCLALSPALAQDADVGAELYTDYCAACHGVSGKGDGDMANVMTIPSPNLTLLSKNNDGEFPMLKVIHIIDGRTGLRAHGGPMPVFGRLFTSDGMGPENPYGSVLEVRGRVLSVALYLESLQE